MFFPAKFKIKLPRWIALRKSACFISQPTIAAVLPLILTEFAFFVKRCLLSPSVWVGLRFLDRERVVAESPRFYSVAEPSLKGNERGDQVRPHILVPIHLSRARLARCRQLPSCTAARAVPIILGLHAAPDRTLSV